jgi:hypothetical protein
MSKDYFGTVFTSEEKQLKLKSPIISGRRG